MKDTEITEAINLVNKVHLFGINKQCDRAYKMGATATYTHQSKIKFGLTVDLHLVSS